MLLLLPIVEFSLFVLHAFYLLFHHVSLSQNPSLLSGLCLGSHTMTRQLLLLVCCAALAVNARKFCPKERNGDECRAKQ